MEKNSTRPFTVAVTGGVGSGKSRVGEIFKTLGICVLDADHIVHELLGPNSPFSEMIRLRFGNTFIQSDNSINRTLLGDRIFQSSTDRQWLESLLHPQVYACLWEKASQCSTPYCVMLIPLLFESGYEKEFDRILVIDTSSENQYQRLQQRPGYSTEKIQRIIAAQIPAKERLIKADDVIENNGDLKTLEAQVLSLHHKYLGQSGK